METHHPRYAAYSRQAPEAPRKGFYDFQTFSEPFNSEKPPVLDRNTLAIEPLDPNCQGDAIKYGDRFRLRADVSGKSYYLKTAANSIGSFSEFDGNLGVSFSETKRIETVWSFVPAPKAASFRYSNVKGYNNLSNGLKKPIENGATVSLFNPNINTHLSTTRKHGYRALLLGKYLPVVTSPLGQGLFERDFEWVLKKI